MHLHNSDNSSRPPIRFSLHHFCGISNLPSYGSVYQNQFLCSYSCCSGLTGVISKLSAPFSNMRHSHYMITIHTGAKHVSSTGTKSPYKLLHRTKFPMLLPFNSNLFHEQQLNDWLSLHILHFTHSKSATSYQTWKCQTRTLQAREPHLVNMPHHYLLSTAQVIQQCDWTQQIRKGTDIANEV